MPATTSLPRRCAAEALGTAFLLAMVVGSGIMAERLAGGSAALALLANAVATGTGLVALILALGPISGAHFNPCVSLVDAWGGGLRWPDVPAYVSAQVAGALAGVAAAHAMFGLPAFTPSLHGRGGWALAFSETVATFGLLCVILGCARRHPSWTPLAVGAYITAAYWFTSSTSFANPAVTLARSLTDTFSGIAPRDVPLFVAAQLLGAFAAAALMRWLLHDARPVDLVVPHEDAP